VFPVLLGGHLLLRRHGRALLVALVVGGLVVAGTILAIGWPVHWTYLTQVPPAQARWIAPPVNQSLWGVSARLWQASALTRPVADLGSEAVVVSLGLSLVLLTGTVVAFLSAPHTVAGEAATYSLAVVTALLVTPVTNTYTLLLLAVPLTVLLADLQTRWTRPTFFLLLGAAAQLLARPQEPCELHWQVLAAWCVPENGSDFVWLTPPWRQGWGTLLLAGPFWGTLLLWGLLWHRCCVGRPSLGCTAR
jgi:hypothetical protein